MRSSLTNDRYANAIRLKRSTFAGTFLLVEGSSDQAFYNQFIDKSACVITPIPGKPSSKILAITILKILEQDSFQGVLAIVDADFDHLETLPTSGSNLLRTDSHDLETMILSSNALEKVVGEYSSEDKMSKFDRDFREALLAAGLAIGYLRWISQLDGLNLTFSTLSVKNFINAKTLAIDELALITEVKNKSQAQKLKNEDLQNRMTDQRNPSHDPWQVCCGHDLTEILSFALQKTIGSMKVDAIELERSLRLAYEAVYFCSTQLYQSIRLWESKNQPFNILQEPQST
jgi:Protein of unknown function (DUF4435)